MALPPALAALLALPALSGCGAVKRFAIHQLGDALAEGGSVYESDDDPDLVGEALPFSLKLIESLLAQSPGHEGLLLAAARGFTSYTYGWVEQESEVAAAEDFERGRLLRARCGRLYLRGHRYGLRGLEAGHPGVAFRLTADPQGAAALVTEPAAVPLLYWTAASLGLAISSSRGDAAMLARIPEVEALLGRALALDEDWGEGALHEFEITFAGSRPSFGPERIPDLRRRFERARELSEGRRASLYVTWAESVCVRTQNAVEFRQMLEAALAVDVDRHPASRLPNLLAQRRARFLLDRIESLFLDAGGTGDSEKEIG